MIVEKTGHIHDSQRSVVVNTVNTVGVMGAGLALINKMIFPEMFNQYKAFCDNKQFDVGQLWLYTNSSRWAILNFPTKKHWRDDSDYYYLTLGLKKFVDTYEMRGIRDIAFPYLGCQNGHLRKDKVKEIMYRFLDPLPIQVELWEYDFNAESTFFNEFKNSMKDINSMFGRIVGEVNSWNELLAWTGISWKTVQKEIQNHFKIETV